jgi:phosphohistidine swiveling domain-containing protein
MSARIVPLAAATRETCGDKAANLARLLAGGCRIPDGTVLPKIWLEEHLARCRLDKALLALEGADEVTSRAAASVIRESIVAVPLDPALRAVLAEIDSRRRGHRLAVRSSALGEDSREFSFAGQLDSVLGVAGIDALQDAVRGVWASLWSERCVAYQRRNGCRLRALGVIICEQIEAAFSGVLFTRAPVGSNCPSDSMLIEYCEGLGDKLVGGDVTPGTAAIARLNGALLREVAPPGSTAWLGKSPAQIELLARGAIRLEREFRMPLDIEWTIDATGNVWFLQARPITAAAPLTVWSNANIAENFPGVVSPMLYSIARRGYSAYFRNLGLGFGISRKRIEAMQDALENIIGMHCGRLYYNLSNIHALLHLVPGGAWLARFFNDFTGAEEYPLPRALPGMGFLAHALELLRVTVGVAWQYSRVRARVARFETVVDAFCGRYPPELLDRLPLESLRCAVLDFLDIRLRRWNDAALADTAAMVCYGLLRLVVHRAFSGHNEASLHNTLLKGLPGLASNAPVTRLWQISRRVRDDTELRLQLRRCTAAEFAARLDRPELGEFAREFRDYLERWGFRSSQELMLTVPTPPERPEDAIALLKLYVELEGPAPDALIEGQAAERIALTDDLVKRLAPAGLLPSVPFLGRAARFRLVLAATQDAIRLRERARFRQALLYTRLRRILLAIGDRLAGRGVFATRDDVFFLEVDELDALLTGDTAMLRTTPSLVAARRESQERFKRSSLPDTMRSRPGELIDGDEVRPPATIGLQADLLHGTGACGGAYRGVAAVLEDAREAAKLSPGSLLVTRQTDPGWAAVFFLVRGLVVERGGMLSHGAIIAREYGIPAVVGVAGAMQLIRSGDEVEVDGDRGTVGIFRG